MTATGTNMIEVESYEQDGKTIRIFQDPEPFDPRKEFDHLGTMLYVSHRYILGDEHSTTEEIDNITNRNDIVWLPVYAYIHSGVTVNTTGYSCPWDSGQCGIIYVEKETILKEYGAKRFTKAMREKAEEILRMEVKEFDQYLTGDVYGFVIEDENGETMDSCWGFYGLEYCREDVKALADSYTKS